MSDIAISVENLSKSYLVGHNTRQMERDVHLREILARSGRDLVRKTRDMFAGRPIVQGDEVEEFWALNDVSFDIKQGDRVGIIGRNGAGKSTLLKILSRITEPTKGRIRINGRVASLLEVGTGFHPELSGRENIFLNGAILGMTRREVQNKFNAIVDFAEVEKFLDTPVKRYSSGMYLRLAFSVASHFESEVLIADEVLAVGDTRFQSKCLDKMGQISREGRTVLFVSHNMAAIRQLCERVLVFENGGIVSNGPTHDSIKAYFGNVATNLGSVVEFNNISNKAAYFSWVSLYDSAGTACRQFCIGDDLCVRFNFRTSIDMAGAPIKLALQLRTSDGIALCNMTDTDSHFQLERSVESNSVDVRISDLRFYPGEYFVSLWAGTIDSRSTYDFAHDCICFEITDGGTLTNRTLPREAGLFFLTPEWKMQSHL